MKESRNPAEIPRQIDPVRDYLLREYTERKAQAIRQLYRIANRKCLPKSKALPFAYAAVKDQTRFAAPFGRP
jgi:hypothetical protein